MRRISSLLCSRRGESRRLLDACASLVAGEVAFRSRRDLGYTGLAQREGFQTAEKLIQNTTGSTAREATTLVAVGVMVHEAMVEEAVDPVTGEVPAGFMVREPWLTGVGVAVSAGTLSVEAARAIKSGLGEPMVDAEGVGVTGADLAGVAVRLLAEAPALDADRVFRLARQLRDELDLEGIAVREQLLYQQRSFRRTRRTNGLSRYTLDPDLETAAYLDDLYDTLTSPRRGGPRFVDLAHSGRTGPGHRERPCHRDRHRPPRRQRPAGLDRSRAADHLHLRNGHDHRRRERSGSGPRARSAPVHRAAENRPRRPRRRLPLARLRSAPCLDRSPPHQPLGRRR